MAERHCIGRLDFRLCNWKQTPSLRFPIGKPSGAQNYLHTVHWRPQKRRSWLFNCASNITVQWPDDFRISFFLHRLFCIARISLRAHFSGLSSLQHSSDFSGPLLPHCNMFFISIIIMIGRYRVMICNGCNSGLKRYADNLVQGCVIHIYNFSKNAMQFAKKASVA